MCLFSSLFKNIRYRHVFSLQSRDITVSLSLWTRISEYRNRFNVSVTTIALFWLRRPRDGDQSTPKHRRQLLEKKWLANRADVPRYSVSSANREIWNHAYTLNTRFNRPHPIIQIICFDIKRRHLAPGIKQYLRVSPAWLCSLDG